MRITQREFLCIATLLLGTLVAAPGEARNASNAFTAQPRRDTTKRLFSAALQGQGPLKLRALRGGRLIRQLTRAPEAQRDWAEYRDAMGTDPVLVKLVPQRGARALTPAEQAVAKGTVAILSQDTRNAPHVSIIQRRTGKVFLSGGPAERFGLSWQHGPATMGFK